MALLCSAFAAADDGGIAPVAPPPPEIPTVSLSEDPPALLSLDQVIDSVELRIKGSWKADLSSSPHVAWGPTGFSATFDGPPLAFAQRPDLEIYLGFLDAWTFEALIGPEGEADSIALSYKGRPDAFVRRIVAGNRGLALPRLEALSLGQNAARWPGMSFSLGDEGGRGAEGPWRFSADALLRYEENAVEERSYRGKSLLVRWEMAAGEYLRGRFFRFPDADISGFRLFVRDAGGTFLGEDGYRYAERSLAGQYLSLSEGRMALSAPITERALLVYRRKDGGPPTDASESIDGSDALLLFDPLLQTTPWEDLSYYALPLDLTEGSNARLSVEYSHPVEPSSFDALIGEYPHCFKVIRVDHEQSSDPISLRPFLDAFPWMYEPGGQQSPDIPARIILEVSKEVDGYTLPMDTIPSSITVWIQGKKTSAWSFVAPNLTMLDAIGPNDEVLIRYSRARSTWSGDQGGLSFGFAMDAFPRKDLSLHAGGGFSWALPFGEPTAPGEERRGKAVMEGGLSWKPPHLELSMKGRLSYEAPDARDIVRILPMESRRIIFEASSATWLVPKEPLLPTGLAPASRVLPLYRDYLRRGPFGTSLMPLDWEDAPEALDPAIRTGPYAVADDRYGQVMVLEASLPSGSWTGMQARFDDALKALAPGTVSFVLPVAWKGLEGPAPTLSLQAGAIGGGENEDDPPLEDVRVIASTDFVPTEEWALVELPLDQVQLGGGASGLRVILHSPVPASGRLLVGTGFLRGASFRLETDDPDADFLLEERSSLNADDDPATAFRADYARLHADGQPNGYLRLRAVANPLAEPVRVSTATAGFDAASHKRLSLYLRPSSDLSVGTRMSLSLEGKTGNALTWSAAIGGLGNAWHRLDLDLAKGEASLLSSDGTRVLYGQMATGTGPTGRVTFSFEGMAEGAVDMDELCLAEPIGSLSSRLEGSLVWTPAWKLLPFAGTALLSEPSLTASLSFLDAELPLWKAAAQARLKILWLSLLSGFGLALPIEGTPSMAIMHEVALPLAFMEARSRFDSRPLAGWKAFDSLKLGWKRTYIKAESGAAVEGETGEAAMSMGAAVAMGDENIKIALATLRQGADGGAPSGGDYFADLRRSWEYRFAPPGSATARRSANASIKLDREGSGRGDFSLEAATSYEGRSAGLFSGSLRARLSPAIVIGPAAFLTLTPSYERNAAFSRRGLARDLGEDLASWESLACLASAYWMAAPFAEFLQDSASSLLASFDVEPVSYALASETGLSFERSPGLGWLDLLVPLRAEWKYAKRDERRGSVVSGNATMSASVEHAAVDIFGSRGVLSLRAPWAEDEYHAMHRLALSWPDGAERPQLDWRSELQAAWICEGGEDFRLAEDFSLRTAASDGSQSWTNRLEAGLRTERWAVDSLDARRVELAAWLARRSAAGMGPRLPFLLAALESGRLRSYAEWKLSFNLSENRGLSWKLPLSWTAGLKLAGSADARVQAGLSASGTGTETFGLGFTFAASVQFSF